MERTAAAVPDTDVQDKGGVEMRFWNTAAAAALAVCTVLAQPAAVQAQDDERTPLEKSEVLICAINDIRADYGLQELATMPVMIECSMIRAEEISTKWGHYRPRAEGDDTPDGKDNVCFTLLAEKGVTYKSGLAAENIAGGHSDVLDTVDQFMNSEGHRANILNPDFTHIGVGYYYAPGSTLTYYWGMFLIGKYDGEVPYVCSDQYFPERAPGDVNGSKTINSMDASEILRYAGSMAAGVEYPVVHDFKAAADVNGDGAVNAVDASIVLRYTAAHGAGSSEEIGAFIW